LPTVHNLPAAVQWTDFCVYFISDKKCSCKKDGICTCPEGACECK